MLLYNRKFLEYKLSTEWGERKASSNHTLKSLLTPKALETLNAKSNYFFCDSIDCPVVYFNDQGQTFILVDKLI